MRGNLLLSLLFQLFFLLGMLDYTLANVPEEKRLRDDLLGLYNWTVRPVRNFTDRLYIYLRFRLARVAELDVKDQVLTLHVTIEQEWTDYKFNWDPAEYGGIVQINLPSENIWRPDFQLYNKFGHFEMLGETVQVFHDGTIKWVPFATVRTFCPIEVRYYPFDIQTCFLNFGSWTHDGNLLFITLKDLPESGVGILPVGMVLNDYYPSSEWDLLEIPAETKSRYYDCCVEPYLSINFNVTLRRHPHFYLVNLVSPLVGLSYLSLLVFYLPADSCEKITLCVSLLTCQVMFLLLMMDNIPVTSLAVPLLGKIIIFNMILVFFSVFCTTIVLNVHYRKPTTHTLPNWVRRIRYTVIPKLLLLEALPLVPLGEREEDGMEDSESKLKKFSRLCSLSLMEIDRKLQASSGQPPQQSSKDEKFSLTDIRKAYHNVCYVQNYMQRQELTTYECEDWKFLASVLDRIFLILFNVAFITGTAVIMMDATALYDHRKPVDKTLSIIKRNIQPTEQDYLSFNASLAEDEKELMGDSLVFDEYVQ